MQSEVPLVVSTEWLNHQISQSATQKLHILDVTWYSSKDAMQDFAKRHIQGAVHFNLFQGVELTPENPRKVADAGTFELNARGAGVDDESHVVLCDGCDDRYGFFTGPRVLLMFKMYGHEKVSILDGGLEKWIADGYETTNMCLKIREGNFKAKRPSRKWMISYDDMVKNLEQRSAQVCDSRLEKLFKGHADDPKTGHYPGAVNITYQSLLDNKTRCLKTTEELTQVFNDAGIDLSKPVTTMCYSGMSSSALALAAHLCGCPEVGVFFGGFNEWKNKAGPSNIAWS